jgi:hypothetical protein
MGTGVLSSGVKWSGHEGNHSPPSSDKVKNVCRLKNLKIKIYKTIILCYFVWVWNLVSHMKERTQTKGISEQGAEKNIWT